MTKNWNTKTTEEIVKILKNAFFEDLHSVDKKCLKLLIEKEADSITRSNSIYPKKSLQYLQDFIKQNKVSSYLFNLRKIILRYTFLPNYISERNKIVMFYTNLAKKLCKKNEELYQNIIIGIIEGIDSYTYSKKYALGPVIKSYIQKNANVEFDTDYSYPYKVNSSIYYFSKKYKIQLKKSEPLKIEEL